MTRYRADAELVPTERCCVLHTRFTDAKSRGLLMEVPGDAIAFEADAARRTIRFTSQANEGGVPVGFATYYIVRFDEPWSSLTTSTDKRFTAGIASFAALWNSLCMPPSQPHSFHLSRPGGTLTSRWAGARPTNCG